MAKSKKTGRPASGLNPNPAREGRPGNSRPREAERRQRADGYPAEDLLSKCEGTIRENVEAYHRGGCGAATIQDRGLYKLDGFETFEAYCRARWDFSRARAYQLIESADVVENVYNCRQTALPLPS